MKPSIKIIHILFASLICSVSCESAIDLGDDGLGTVLMMNAQLCTSDTTHTVMLALSSQKGIDSVKTATISCYVNDRLVSKCDTIDRIQEIAVGFNFETLKSFKQSYSFLHFDARFKPGDVVCIKADSGDLHCESCVTVPPAASILGVKVTECVSDAEKQFGDYKFEIQVEDITNEMSYYSLKLLNNSYLQVAKTYDYETDVHVGDLVLFEPSEVKINNTMDPLLNSGGETIASTTLPQLDSYLDNKLNLFTDSMFRDKSYTITVFSQGDIYARPHGGYSPGEYVEYKVATVRLLNLSKEEYQYLTGFQFYGSAESNDLFTYVFPSNVKDGLGFVSISSASDYEIKIAQQVL